MNKQPLPDTLPSPVTEAIAKPEVPMGEIKEAANEGRVSIRPKEMSVAVIAKINDAFGDSKVVEALTECFNATKTIAVGGLPLEVPDYKIRLDTAKVVMQYQVGNAVTRQEIVTHNVDTLSSLQSKLQRSPALRRAVGNMLQGSDGNVVDVSPQRELSQGETEEAQEVLQHLPDGSETEVGKEIRKVVNTDNLPSSGTFDTAEEKYA